MMEPSHGHKSKSLNPSHNPRFKLAEEDPQNKVTIVPTDGGRDATCPCVRPYGCLCEPHNLAHEHVVDGVVFSLLKTWRVS